MSDGRCATCKWWEAYESGGQAWPEPTSGWRECALAQTDTSDRDPFPHALAKAHGDGHDIYGDDVAHLFTSPDFGCILWEAKG